MTRIVEIGTVSSRGQIAIPAGVRKELDLKDGEKVLFAVEGNTLVIKKLDIEKTWAEITKPLRDAPKKIREDEVVDLIHRFRKEKRNENHN